MLLVLRWTHWKVSSANGSGGVQCLRLAASGDSAAPATQRRSPPRSFAYGTVSHQPHFIQTAAGGGGWFSSWIIDESLANQTQQHGQPYQPLMYFMYIGKWCWGLRGVRTGGQRREMEYRIVPARGWHLVAVLQNASFCCANMCQLMASWDSNQWRATEKKRRPRKTKGCCGDWTPTS